MPLTINTSIESSESKEIIQNSNKLSPTTVKDVKEIILSSSKNILGKVLSPAKDKDKIQVQNAKKVDKKPALMTRRELTDPFGSDEEEESVETCENDDKNDIKAAGDVNETEVETDNKLVLDYEEMQKELPKSAQVISISLFTFCSFFLFIFCVAS